MRIFERWVKFLSRIIVVTDPSLPRVIAARTIHFDIDPGDSLSETYASMLVPCNKRDISMERLERDTAYESLMEWISMRSEWAREVSQVDEQEVSDTCTVEFRKFSLKFANTRTTTVLLNAPPLVKLSLAVTVISDHELPSDTCCTPPSRIMKAVQDEAKCEYEATSSIQEILLRSTKAIRNIDLVLKRIQAASTTAHLNNVTWSTVLVDMQRIDASHSEDLNRLTNKFDRSIISIFVVNLAQHMGNHCYISDRTLAFFLFHHLTSDLHREIILCFRDVLAWRAVKILDSILIDPRPFTQACLGAMAHVRLQHIRITLCINAHIVPRSLFLTGLQIDLLEDPACGSYSDVYSGTYQGQRVALKRLRAGTTGDTQFFTEAFSWSLFKNEFLLPLLGLDRQSCPPHFVMVSPWMKNGNIRQCSARLSAAGQPVPFYRWAYEVAQGMLYLHAQKYVHGDLRGANVLVDDEYHIKIADFGLTFNNDYHLDRAESHPGGCKRSMAPELIPSGAPPTQESDVYAFGCLLIEIFTGQLPFPGRSDNSVIVLVLREANKPVRPEHMNDRIWALTGRCLSKVKEDRPSFADITAELEAFV